MESERIPEFMVEAKTKAYASGNAYSDGNGGSKEFMFTSGNLKYTDRYVGSIFFAGQETLFESNIPVWSMVYYGGMLDDSCEPDEVYNFLRTALRNIPLDLPLRGSKYFHSNKFVYKNEAEGDLSHFIGYESIENTEDIIYELHYSGGSIE
ncbi:DUF5680 domain-containing protein [Ferroplasma sp.]|uniref:DUF5680 domain-containing protein n=1 Tax=Ferroplasma sp. TaxID=2591003 RepID=UPI00307E570C